jgi:hypothetical protein
MSELECRLLFYFWPLLAFKAFLQIYGAEKPTAYSTIGTKENFFFVRAILQVTTSESRQRTSFRGAFVYEGSLPPSIPLEIGGSRILVTSAVKEFLFYQRSVFHSKLFWIDSVSINQEGRRHWEDVSVALDDRNIHLIRLMCIAFTLHRIGHIARTWSCHKIYGSGRGGSARCLRTGFQSSLTWTDLGYSRTRRSQGCPHNV